MSITGIQFIEKHGKHEYAVVPVPLYQRMVEAMEDREDITALVSDFTFPQLTARYHIALKFTGDICDGITH